MPGLFDDPLINYPFVYNLADGLGYLVCAFALAKMMLLAHQWYVTLSLYGGIPWNCIRHMVVFTVTSQVFPRWYLSCIAVVLAFLLPYVMAGTLFPLSLVLGFLAFQLLVLRGWHRLAVCGLPVTRSGKRLRGNDAPLQPPSADAAPVAIGMATEASRLSR